MTLLLRPQDAALPVAAEATVARSAVNPVVRAAFYLFIASIPFEIPHRTIPLEIPTLTGFILLFVTALDLRACYRKIPAALGWFLVYGWVLMAMAIATSEHRDLVVTYFLSLAQLLWLFVVITNLLADELTMRGLLWTMVLSCTVRAGAQVAGLGRTARAVWTGGERVSAFGQNANLSAMILAAGLAVAVGLVIQRGKGLPRIGLFAIPVGLVIALSVIQTGSRGGLLSLGAGLAVYLFSGRTLALRVRNLVLGVGAIVALSVAAERSPMMRARMAAAAEEGNLAGREKIYPAALAMIRERPLLGWGPLENQFEIAVRIHEHKKIKRDAHNLFLDLLSSTGVLGTIPFLIGLGLVFRGAWQARRGPLGMLPLAVLLAVFVGCLSGTWIESKILWLAFALAVAAGLWWRPSALETRWQSCAV